MLVAGAPRMAAAPFCVKPTQTSFSFANPTFMPEDTSHFLPFGRTKDLMSVTADLLPLTLPYTAVVPLKIPLVGSLQSFMLHLNEQTSPSHVPRGIFLVHAA